MSTLQNKADDLARLIVAGDRPSMETFYKMHVPMLWPVAMRYARDQSDAKSILNLAMLKIFRALPNFPIGERPLGPWMKAICINSGIDAVRSRARFSSSQELTMAHDQQIDADLEGQFSRSEILDLLKKLPEMQRTVLVLFAVEGFSHAEIAEKTGLTENNSRWHLHQARLGFKKLLAKMDSVAEVVSLIPNLI